MYHMLRAALALDALCCALALQVRVMARLRTGFRGRVRVRV